MDTEAAIKDTAKPEVEQAFVDDVRTTNDLQVTYPSRSSRSNAPAMISQDDDDDVPSRNTGATARNKLLVAAEISGSCPTPKQAASHQYRLQFLVDLVGEVFDQKPNMLKNHKENIRKQKALVRGHCVTDCLEVAIPEI